MDTLDTILAQEIPIEEKLAAAYNQVTATYIADLQNQLELMQAIGDQETIMKERIKIGVMNAARDMFEYVYRRATGKRDAWDE